jgi:chromosome partitioning protein
MPVRIWSLVQSKGGSGKSTLATNVAAQAEEAGEVVLLIDLDAQSSATLWGQLRGNKTPTVHEGRVDTLTEVITSATTLGVTLIIIDTASKNDATQLAAIRASDLIICPVMVDLFSLAGLQDTARLLEMAGKLDISVAVINNLDEAGSAANIEQARAALKAIGMTMSPDAIYHRPAYAAAIKRGLAVTELGGKQKAAAEEIQGLWAWLNKRSTAKAASRRKVAKETAKS